MTTSCKTQNNNNCTGQYDKTLWSENKVAGQTTVYMY